MLGGAAAWDNVDKTKSELLNSFELLLSAVVLLCVCVCVCVCNCVCLCVCVCDCVCDCVCCWVLFLFFVCLVVCCLLFLFYILVGAFVLFSPAQFT